MTQRARIKEVLLCGVSITPLEALRWFGCSRLAARIRELKEAGMNIVTTMVKVSHGKSVARYHLIREEATADLFLTDVREVL